MTASKDPPPDESPDPRAIRSMLLDALHAMQSLAQSGSTGTGDKVPESLIDRLFQLTGPALRLGARATDTSVRVGRALLSSQEQLRAMLIAGQSLKDIREVAGLTLTEMT